MSLCTVCGRYLCDHTAEERGQTQEEMMRPLTEDEVKAFEKYRYTDKEGYISEKIEAARKAQREATESKSE